MIYELAYHLKTPVYVLAENMPYTELIGWQCYFERRPIGWREDDRTFKLLQVQGFKGTAGSVFPSLAKLNYRPATVDASGKLDIINLKQSFLFQQILSAKDGVKLEYDKN